MRKKLVFIFNIGDQENAAIKQAEDEMIEAIKKNDGNGINISRLNIMNAAELVSELKSLFNEPWDEYYIHYSGHGLPNEIIFKDSIANDALKNLFYDGRVKFCFLSACFSFELAQLLSPKIPYVIGSKNKMGVKFGERLTQRFYELSLKDKMSIPDAFHKSFSEFNPTAKDEIGTKVYLTFSELTNPKQLNDLNLIAATNEDLHILYPSLLEELRVKEENNKQLLICWGNQEGYFETFETWFIAEGFNEIYDLFELPVKEEGDFFEILLILPSTKIIFFQSQNNLLPNVFNVTHSKNDFISSEKFSALLICFHEGNKEKIQEDLISVFKKEELLIELPEIVSADNLYKEEELETKLANFLSESRISFEERKSITLEFDCEPSKEEIQNPAIDDDRKHAFLFYLKNDNQRLIHFLINWLKDYEEIYAPIIIIDTKLMGQKETLNKLLAQQLQQHYVGDSLEELIDNYLRAENKGIILFRLHQSNDEKIKQEIKDILNSINKILCFYQKTIKRKISDAYLFAIHDTNTINAFFDSCKQEKDLNLLSFNTISSPNEIEKAIIDEWEKSLKKRGKKYREIIPAICQTICFNSPEDKQVDVVIQKICKKFNIPVKKILELT